MNIQDALEKWAKTKQAAHLCNVYGLDAIRPELRSAVLVSRINDAFEAGWKAAMGRKEKSDE